MGKVSGSFKSASLFNSKAESSGDDASDDDRRSPKSEDDGSESDVNSDEEDLQEQVADFPFEVLQKARSDGRSSSFSRSQNIETKRANKNRPMEVTSKKPVPRFREVIQAPKKVLRDPRFESLSGNFDETRFKQAYKFLYEEELPAERQKLQKLLEKKTGSIEAEDLKRNLAWIDRQLKEEAIRRETATKHAERKTKDKEAIKKGKRLYFPKKSELKKAQLVDKFEKLKESGKLDAFLAKRRKKNAAKDHRYMPYRRPQQVEDK